MDPVLGSCDSLARADYAVTTLYIPKSSHPYRVHVIKSRKRQSSVHAFKTVVDAAEFIFDLNRAHGA